MGRPLRLGALLLGLVAPEAGSFRVTVDLNTYTSDELGFAARAWAGQLDGTWTLANNSGWNGSATQPSDAQWRDALAAVGPEQFSEQMWPCSAADDAAWNCSGIAGFSDHSAQQCQIVRRLAPRSQLSGAFAYHETGSLPHTMLSWAELGKVSRACGGAGVLGHTRLYQGPWKTMVDAVLAHPKLLGVVMEIDITKYSPGHVVFGQAGPFARAMLAAGKQPFFLLPLKADGANTTGMPAAGQIRAFLRNVTAEVQNASLLADPRINVVVARYGRPGLLAVSGGGEDTVAAAVAAALAAKRAPVSGGSNRR